MRAFLGLRRSHLIALAVAAAAVAWMATGTLNGAREGTATAAPAPATPAASPLLRVRVREITAEPIRGEVIIHARSEPARKVTLRAEVDGRVVAVGPERGARVRRGELIVRLDPRARKARVAEAESLLAQRRLEYQAARRLEASQYQSEAQVARARAALEAARAALERARVELANTEVRAPFDGILERRPVEIGAYLGAGKEVAEVIETDPLVIAGAVSQRERNLLRVGARGEATLITGERVSGTVRYLSAQSDSATRTFRVELEVPNPDGVLVAGVTAEIRIPTGSRPAHRLSPAALALDEAERIGVKSVDGEGVVRFHPVEIVRAEAGAVWVAGLPERVRVITVGHGFVRAGERVVPVLEGEAPAT